MGRKSLKGCRKLEMKRDELRLLLLKTKIASVCKENNNTGHLMFFLNIILSLTILQSILGCITIDNRNNFVLFSCWLSVESGSLLLFIVPVCCTIVVSIACTVTVLYLACTIFGEKLFLNKQGFDLTYY